MTAQAEKGVNLSDYTVAFTGRFAWDRIGTVTVNDDEDGDSSNGGGGNGTRMVLQGHGLAAVEVRCTADQVRLQCEGSV